MLVFLSPQPVVWKHSLPWRSAEEGAPNGVASRPEAEHNTLNNFCTPRRDQLPRRRFGGG